MARLLLTLMIAVYSMAIYANCDPFFIRHIGTNNSGIALSNNTVWEVFPKDRDKVWPWKIGDEVMLCYGFMVNKVQDDTQVSIRYAGNYCQYTGRGCTYNPYHTCCGAYWHNYGVAFPR